jgi:hypothetical protein
VDADPLRITAPLALEAEFYPLGFPVRLATNSPEIVAAASASWRHFPKAFEESPIELQVLVEFGDDPPKPPRFRARQHLITIGSGANFAVCDHTRRLACCWLNQAAAADASFVRYYYLEAMVLFTLTQLYVTPVHGACVARHGRALLLCGDSGAGKSTLAYACARRGWAYISDNETWLLRSDARTILGNPARIRLRESASDLFSELESKPSVCFNGKRSILLDSTGLNIAFQSQPQRIVFLKRTPGTPSLSVPPMTASEALSRLLAGIIQYTPAVREAHRESLERFTQIPALEFTYSGLEDALPALESLLA